MSDFVLNVSGFFFIVVAHSTLFLSRGSCVICRSKPLKLLVFESTLTLHILP